MDTIKLKARAKINLGLDVIGKREDGYHEVRMIMQSLNMYDGVEISRIEEPEIRIITNRSYLPTNSDNLMYKAAQLIREEYNIKDGVEIKLEKFIPVAAGMAGGSSDDAATLVGMNRLFNLRITTEHLMELGVKIGADVPFCIMRGTVLAEGIGEKLTQLAPMPDCPILIAKPGINVSTRYVYQNLKLDDKTVHPDIDGIIDSLERHNIDGICARMGNVLESVTAKEYPVIGEIKQEMLKCGAINSLMSGSGPTVFGIFKSKQYAYACADRLKEIGIAKQVYVTGAFCNRQ